jgi:hypothetical protein
MLSFEEQLGIGVNSHKLPPLRYRNTLYLYGGRFFEIRGENRKAFAWYTKDILSDKFLKQFGFYLTDLKTTERLVAAYRVPGNEKKRRALKELIDKCYLQALLNSAKYGKKILTYLAEHPQQDLMAVKIGSEPNNKMLYMGEPSREVFLSALLYNWIVRGIAFTQIDYSRFFSKRGKIKPAYAWKQKSDSASSDDKALPISSDQYSNTLEGLFPDLQKFTPQAHLEKITKIARNVPDDAISCVIFKIPMDDSSQVGFSMRIDRKQAAFLNSSPWQALNTFCQTWASQDSDLDDIEKIWLELDIIEGIPRDPLVFFRSTDMAVIQRFISFFCAKDYSKKSLDIMKRCLSCLSEEIRLKHQGLLHARKANALRMYVEPYNEAALQRYLSAIRYPNDMEYQVLSLYSHLRELFDTIHFQVDIRNQLLPTVAFECKPEPGPTERWPQVIDYLKDQDLCTRQKQLNILQWPGVVTFAHADSGKKYQVTKYINHIKIDSGEDAGLKLKAYLAAQKN